MLKKNNKIQQLSNPKKIRRSIFEIIFKKIKIKKKKKKKPRRGKVREIRNRQKNAKNMNNTL